MLRTNTRCSWPYVLRGKWSLTTMTLVAIACFSSSSAGAERYVSYCTCEWTLAMPLAWSHTCSSTRVILIGSHRHDNLGVCRHVLSRHMTWNTAYKYREATKSEAGIGILPAQNAPATGYDAMTTGAPIPGAPIPAQVAHRGEKGVGEYRNVIICQCTCHIDRCFYSLRLHSPLPTLPLLRWE